MWSMQYIAYKNIGMWTCGAYSLFIKQFNLFSKALDKLFNYTPIEQNFTNMLHILISKKKIHQQTFLF